MRKNNLIVETTRFVIRKSHASAALYDLGKKKKQPTAALVRSGKILTRFEKPEPVVARETERERGERGEGESINIQPSAVVLEKHTTSSGTKTKTSDRQRTVNTPRKAEQRRRSRARISYKPWGRRERPTPGKHQTDDPQVCGEKSTPRKPDRNKGRKDACQGGGLQDHGQGGREQWEQRRRATREGSQDCVSGGVPEP